MSFINKLNNERVTAETKWHALSMFRRTEPLTQLQNVKKIKYV